MATDRARCAGQADRLHFETAPLHELPYQNAVFDLALAEIELGAAVDPTAAVAELARVVRAGGTVVLIQLVWTRAIEEPRRSELVEQLGVRPMMVMEWKQMLRSAGIGELRVEDWSDAALSPDRPSVLGGSRSGCWGSR